MGNKCTMKLLYLKEQKEQTMEIRKCRDDDMIGKKKSGHSEETQSHFSWPLLPSCASLTLCLCQRAQGIGSTLTPLAPRDGGGPADLGSYFVNVLHLTWFPPQRTIFFFLTTRKLKEIWFSQQTKVALRRWPVEEKNEKKSRGEQGRLEKNKMGW